MARELRQGDRVRIVGASATTGSRECYGFQATIARKSAEKYLLQISTRKGVIRDWYRKSAVRELGR